MTNTVSMLGQSAPVPGARDAKLDEDHALASFAGVLAGINHANATPVAPKPQADGMADGDPLENADDIDSTVDIATSDDATGGSAVAAVSSVDLVSAATVAVASCTSISSSIAALNPAVQDKLADAMSRLQKETGDDVQISETVHSQRVVIEEGLRTLVTADSGGLDLPAKSSAMSRALNALTIGDATGDSGDDDSIVVRILELSTPTQQSSSQSGKKSIEISHLDRLGDAVNASRVEDGSTMAETRTTTAVKPQMALGATMFRAPSIGRSANQGFNSDRHSSDRETAGYSAISLRGPAPTQFSIAEVATQMISTATQRAEQIMAAQDAPARPLSQIVMSVDAGNGATDRIQVALHGSTVSATIDAGDHRTADAMRVHSDDLVRSLTKDGVDVDSVRIRSTASTTNAAPVTTIASSQKSSDSSNTARFSREAQWDEQRSQQRSNSERRHHQRGQRGGKES